MQRVRVTGEQREAGARAPWRVEVQVHGGEGRLAFTQSASSDPGLTLASCVLAGEPRLLTAHGKESGALLVGAPGEPVPSLVGPAALDARGLERAEPILGLLADGLYTLSVSAVTLDEPRAGFVASGAHFELLGANQHGTPVLMGVAGSGLLVGGAIGCARGQPALLISADVIVDAPGFVAHEHDRGAREAFSRAPGGVLEDRALRDAVARHKERYPTAFLGPFALEKLEPAGDQARALAMDLALEDVVEHVGEVQRIAGPRTEFLVPVRARTLLFEVAFVSSDGRRIDEVLVRSGGRLRASGGRPAARAMARVLRQLADEGA